ncbi:hypothetical protein CTI12_AA302350 [Artemisia annua]|uniref:Uncharacterized protein n=1 Tax=Artemisia annua TaxID=35608 RepID=A0A2U1MBT3_ARTAN|nr:hypothetical protein CTI12_AA302350 [Artemisia annua]
MDALSVTNGASAPQMMKTLAKCYFGVIEKYLVSKYSLSSRQVAILSCIRAPHAQDFLFTITIDGLGQRMNHRQFRSVLCYRLSVPMFSEGSLFLSCNVHRMDKWGDHAVHCSSEVGVKFRHNLVRDILVDICSKVGIMGLENGMERKMEVGKKGLKTGKCSKEILGLKSMKQALFSQQKRYYPRSKGDICCCVHYLFAMQPQLRLHLIVLWALFGSSFCCSIALFRIKGMSSVLAPILAFSRPEYELLSETGYTNFPSQN